jgi:penicillin amidase
MPIRSLPVLLSAVALGVAMQAVAKESPTAAAAQTIAVPGLSKPADILIDRWGVPHIYAKSEDDGFFAQGFNAARDRLFQIDLWRRRGLGQLSEVFGPAYVEQDRATRLFLYRGDMQTEWNRYSPDAQRIATRFVAGINAYVDWLAKHPEQMPFEFRKLNYTPAHWAPEDVVRIRSHGLTRNLQSEVARANVACKANLADDTIRFGLQPAWQTQMPEGLDPCLPKDLLKVFTLATQGVKLTPESLKGVDIDSTRVAATANLEETMEGSNNWVIAPGKSTTGRAVMANDPHRAYSAPSLRYIAHVSTPTLDIIGAGEPSLPAVSIGHNGHVAFGLTIFNIDQEDLYVYELNPANHTEYRYKDGWEPFKVLHETVKVRGGESRPIDLTFTRHGPVIYIDAPRVCRAFGVAVAGHVAVFRLGRLHARPHVRTVQAGDDELGRPHRKPGLCRHEGQHRLGAGRPRPDPPELGRPAARARRRPLRVGRVLARGSAAQHLQPEVWLLHLVQRDEPPARLPVPRTQARLRVDQRLASRAH